MLMKVTIVLDGGKRMKFHRRREQASGKQQEARSFRSSTVAGGSAAAQAQGVEVLGTGYWYMY
jgi:hypothetical protein